MQLFTMANDRMNAHLDRFLTAARLFLPTDIPVRVIPFDDDLDAVNATISRHENTHLGTPDPRLDAIGQRLYGTEDYRPGVPSWRYFRKLNALTGQQTPVVFADVNTLLLADPRAHLPLDTLEHETLIFGGPSLPERTIAATGLHNVLNTLCPGTGGGFNCAFIAGWGDVLTIDLAEHLSHPRWRKLLGVAPEQAFLAIYMGVFGLTGRRLKQLSKQMGPIAGSAGQIEVRDGVAYHAEGPNAGRICLAIKQPGQDLQAIPDSVSAFLATRAETA